MNLEQRTTATSSETQHLSLTPVFSRMALGLCCVVVAAFMFQRALTLPPELKVIETPVYITLDDSQKNEIQSATLRFEGDHPAIRLRALPEENTQDVLRGKVTHRVENKMVLHQASKPQDHDLQATLALNVKPLEKTVVIGHHRHIIDVQLGSFLPLNLGVKNQWSSQKIDLKDLNVRRLTAESQTGSMKITLPQKEMEELSVSNQVGNIRVESREKIKVGRFDVNNHVGDIDLFLKKLEVDDLNVKGISGLVRLKAGGVMKNAEIFSQRGDMQIHILEGSQGNLNMSNKNGDVKLYIHRDVHVRLKFPKKDPIVLPRNAQGKADLEIYIDAQDRYFDYQIR